MTHCLFHHGIQAVTGDLRVRFLRPVSCAATLEIAAWLVSSRAPLHCLKAEIRMERHRMAWAEARFLERRRKT